MKVLLVDDHAIVRAGMRRLLESHNMVKDVFEAESGTEAIKMIEQIEPDLVILDLSMPNLSGIDVLTKVKENKNLDTKFLVLSMFPEKEYALRTLKAGASGYITKDSAADELHLAIDSVLNGIKYVSNNLKEILVEFNTGKNVSAIEKLSDREFKVFVLLAKGKRNQEIADELFISSKTVSTYKNRIYVKLKINSLQELVKYAVNHHLID